MEKPVYFVSDAHFGSQEKPVEDQKRKKFLAFLRHLEGATDRLYILGDLFDFWFEYRRAIFKDHFAVLHHLRSLVDRGMEITYCAGNHDFWLGSFLRQEMGMIVAADPVDITLQDKRLFIAHGDGLIKKDRGYKALKWFLRLPLNVWLFRLVHPDAGALVADGVSRFSRTFLSKEKKFDFTAEFKAFAQEKFQAGFDAVILGHSHIPVLEESGGRYLINSGDWISHFSYVVMENGRFKLKTWE